MKNKLKIIENGLDKIYEMQRKYQLIIGPTTELNEMLNNLKLQQYLCLQKFNQKDWYKYYNEVNKKADKINENTKLLHNKIKKFITNNLINSKPIYEDKIA